MHYVAKLFDNETSAGTSNILSPSGWTSVGTVADFSGGFFRYVRGALTGSPVGTVTLVVGARGVE